MSQDELRPKRHGPSKQEWDRHRSEITTLYVKHGYKRDQVSKHMQDKYGFRASPRQYEERFHQWKARKYITETVRKDFKSKQNQGELNLSPDEERRLKRQFKDHPERKLVRLSVTNSESSVGATTPSSTDNSYPGTSSLEGDDAKLPVVSVTADDGTVQVLASRSWPSTSAGSPMLLFSNIPSRQLSISPPLSRSTTPVDNAETIFFHLRQFCQHYVAKPELSTVRDETNSAVSNVVVQRNTNDLKDIIYLYKIGNFSRADTFLQGYCTLPFESVVDLSVDFLRQVITTLAPINTTRKPAVRQHLLGRLHSLTKVELGPWHPFTVICKHLLLDQDSLETSMRALQVLQNSVMIWSRYLSFQTELDLIAMMRREGNYDNARLRTLVLIDTGTLVFGTDSRQVRKLQLELSAIYMAQKYYDQAINVCRKIHSSSQQDMLTVRAMENLAEAHRLRSEIRASLAWLETAVDLVVRLDGNKVTTTHILDKMFDTLTAAGGPDVAQKLKIYSEKYQAYL